MDPKKLYDEWKNDQTDKKRGKAIELKYKSYIAIENIRKIEIKEENSDTVKIEFVKEIENEETAFVFLCQKVSSKLPPLPIKKETENIKISLYAKGDLSTVEICCHPLCFSIDFISGGFRSVDGAHGKDF